MNRLRICCSFAGLLLLTACGGGGGGDSSPADALFADFFAIYGGGSRSIAGEGVNTAARAYQDCGYTDSTSRADATQEVRTLGGSVSLETEDKWCAGAKGTTLCLVRMGDGAFAVDEDAGTTGGRSVEAVVGLSGGRYAGFESVILPGIVSPVGLVSNTVSATVRDDGIPPSGTCSNGTAPTRGGSDINGSWSGKRVVYDLNNKTGYQQLHTMVCAAQACNIQTRLFIDLSFPEFAAPGVWRTDSQFIQGGAVMSRDGQALALWFCPLAGSAQGPTPFGTDCELYGFTRS